MNSKVAKLAREAGVVGAGGAGFPTHVKLNAHVDYIILNGAECEPLITVDQVLILKDSARLAAMLEEVRKDLGAKEAIIAIKAKHKEAVKEAENAIKPYPAIRFAPLGDFYPAGDEFVLVYETTERQIPHGGLPLEVGVVVLNVETLWNLAEAREGIPVTRKWVTVSGAVNIPGTLHVPLGTSIKELIELAGGPTVSDYEIINGGPMMGKLVTNIKEPVVKTTKGLLVLPKTNPVIQNRIRPLSAILRQAQSLCCQCQMCTDLCPRNLLGYKINPNKTILSASYKWQLSRSQITESFLCSECGVCDLYACPMGLSPRRINQALKGELVRQGIKNPYKGSKAFVNPWRSFRRIPTKRLISRLDLASYHTPESIREIDIRPDIVEIPLKQHVGVPARPIVFPGDRVEVGQLIAEIPEEGKLSSNLFASVSGVITEVTEEKILISSSENLEGVR
jgi:Na+-translocating ferredoxin:NAD+ oxidoreductase RnfC subunit